MFRTRFEILKHAFQSVGRYLRSTGERMIEGFDGKEGGGSDRSYHANHQRMHPEVLYPKEVSKAYNN